jgi:nucleoside-diphosphate-sugar epimerase
MSDAGAPKRYTVVGARGFIGSALVERLRADGHDVTGMSHDAELEPPAGLGHVIYASGIAAAGASDPGYAYAVHVEGLRRIIATGSATSLLYLSSTRVYDGSPDTREGARLGVDPAGSDIYRITKIAGEALCLSVPSAAFRVARLSNVAGASFRSPLFLSDILRQATTGGRVSVRTTRDSAKDYLTIDDACRYLVAIAQSGRERVYNVAHGTNTTNGAIFDALQGASKATIDIAPEAARAVTPQIAVERLHAEFGPAQTPLVEAIPAIYQAFAAHVRA